MFLLKMVKPNCKHCCPWAKIITFKLPYCEYLIFIFHVNYFRQSIEPWVIIYFFQMELVNIFVCLLIGLGFVLLYKTLTLFYGLSSVSGRSSVVVGLHLQLHCERVGDPWHGIPNPALPYETAGPLPIPLLGQGEWQKCAAFCQIHWLIYHSMYCLDEQMKWILLTE